MCNSYIFWGDNFMIGHCAVKLCQQNIIMFLLLLLLLCDNDDKDNLNNAHEVRMIFTKTIFVQNQV